MTSTSELSNGLHPAALPFYEPFRVDVMSAPIRRLVERTMAEIYKPDTDPVFEEMTGVKLSPFWAVHDAGAGFGGGLEVRLIFIPQPGDQGFETHRLLGSLGNWAADVDEGFVRIQIPAWALGSLERLRALVERPMFSGWYRPKYPDGTYIHDDQDEIPTVTVRTRLRVQGQDPWEKRGLLFVAREGVTPAARLPHHQNLIATLIAAPRRVPTGLNIGDQVVFNKKDLARWMIMPDGTILGWVPATELLASYCGAFAPYEPESVL